MLAEPRLGGAGVGDMSESFAAAATSASCQEACRRVGLNLTKLVAIRTVAGFRRLATTASASQTCFRGQVSRACGALLRMTMRKASRIVAFMCSLFAAGCSGDGADDGGGTTVGGGVCQTDDKLAACVCHASQSCTYDCNGVAQCQVKADAESRPVVDCADSPDCQVHCEGAASCEVDCAGGPCQVLCPKSGCTVTNCTGFGTECQVSCGDLKADGALPAMSGTTATCP